MITLTTAQTPYTKELERAISAEIIQNGTLTIAGVTLLITGVKLDIAENGDDIFIFNYHVPERLIIPNLEHIQ